LAHDILRRKTILNIRTDYEYQPQSHISILRRYLKWSLKNHFNSTMNISLKELSESWWYAKIRRRSLYQV